MQVLIDGPGADGPSKGARDNVAVHRQVITCKRLSLTDIVLSALPRNASKNKIISEWEVCFIVSLPH